MELLALGLVMRLVRVVRGLMLKLVLVLVLVLVVRGLVLRWVLVLVLALVLMLVLVPVLVLVLVLGLRQWTIYNVSSKGLKLLWADAWYVGTWGEGGVKLVRWNR